MIPPTPNGKEEASPIPSVIVQLVPGPLVGQTQVQVHYEDCPGGWPMAVQMLVKALDGGLPQAFQQVSAETKKNQPLVERFTNFRAN